MFRFLSSLPELRTLRGDLAIENHWRAAGTLITYTFSALRKLVIKDEGTGINPPAILPFISPKSLSPLHLHAYARSTEDMREHLEELCSSLALAQLRELKIRVELNRVRVYHHGSPNQQPPQAPFHLDPSLADILELRTSSVCLRSGTSRS